MIIINYYLLLLLKLQVKLSTTDFPENPAGGIEYVDSIIFVETLHSKSKIYKIFK